MRFRETKRITRWGSERREEGREEKVTADRSSIIGGEIKILDGCCGSVEALVSARRALCLYAHGQVDEGEHVVLDHDREAEEDGIQDQDVNAQLEVQPPFVQVDAQNLRVHIQQIGLSDESWTS